uniref:Lysosomal trafficking regulator lyst n=1 Tax=Mesocestoides corti TaxID=53468 RepID=A0A5K3FBV7_MESCO
MSAPSGVATVEYPRQIINKTGPTEQALLTNQKPEQHVRRLLSESSTLATPLIIYCISSMSSSGWLLTFLACQWNAERHRIGCGQKPEPRVRRLPSESTTLATPLIIYCISSMSFSGWLIIFLACHWNTERQRIGGGLVIQHVCALIRRHPTATPHQYTTPILALHYSTLTRMLASSGCFTAILDSAIQSALLPCHEEEVTASYWKKITSTLTDVFNSFIVDSLENECLSSRSCIRLIILACQEVLERISIYLSAAGTEDLFKKLLLDDDQCSKTSVFDLFLREVTSCIAHQRVVENGDLISRAPLFRDAVVWVTDKVHYPVISSSQHLSILHPLALQLMEDYRSQIKLLGLRLLAHLAQEVLVASWRSTGRAEATLEVLICQRFAHSREKDLMDSTYNCIFLCLHLLEETQRKDWYNRISDILLCDLALEVCFEKKIVLLKNIARILDVLGRDVMIHSRRLLKAAEITLLAPRSPTYSSQEHESFLRMLEIVHKFVVLGVDCLFPDLVVMVLPMIIAFIDLEWSRRQNQKDSSSLSELSRVLTEIINRIVDADPITMNSALETCSQSVPAIRLFVSTSS